MPINDQFAKRPKPKPSKAEQAARQIAAIQGMGLPFLESAYSGNLTGKGKTKSKNLVGKTKATGAEAIANKVAEKLGAMALGSMAGASSIGMNPAAKAAAARAARQQQAQDPFGEDVFGGKREARKISNRLKYGVKGGKAKNPHEAGIVYSSPPVSTSIEGKLEYLMNRWDQMNPGATVDERNTVKYRLQKRLAERAASPDHWTKQLIDASRRGLGVVGSDIARHATNPLNPIGNSIESAKEIYKRIFGGEQELKDYVEGSSPGMLPSKDYQDTFGEGAYAPDIEGNIAASNMLQRLLGQTQRMNNPTLEASRIISGALGEINPINQGQIAIETSLANAANSGDKVLGNPYIQGALGLFTGALDLANPLGKAQLITGLPMMGYGASEAYGQAEGSVLDKLRAAAASLAAPQVGNEAASSYAAGDLIGSLLSGGASAGKALRRGRGAKTHVKANAKANTVAEPINPVATRPATYDVGTQRTEPKPKIIFEPNNEPGIADLARRRRVRPSAEQAAQQVGEVMTSAQEAQAATTASKPARQRKKQQPPADQPVQQAAEAAAPVQEAPVPAQPEAQPVAPNATKGRKKKTKAEEAAQKVGEVMTSAQEAVPQAEPVATPAKAGRAKAKSKVPADQPVAAAEQIQPEPAPVATKKTKSKAQPVQEPPVQAVEPIAQDVQPPAKKGSRKAKGAPATAPITAREAADKIGQIMADAENKAMSNEQVGLDVKDNKPVPKEDVAPQPAKSWQSSDIEIYGEDDVPAQGATVPKDLKGPIAILDESGNPTNATVISVFSTQNKKTKQHVKSAKVYFHSTKRTSIIPIKDLLKSKAAAEKRNKPSATQPSPYKIENTGEIRALIKSSKRMDDDTLSERAADIIRSKNGSEEDFVKLFDIISERGLVDSVEQKVKGLADTSASKTPEPQDAAPQAPVSGKSRAKSKAAKAAGAAGAAGLLYYGASQANQGDEDKKQSDMDRLMKLAGISAIGATLSARDDSGKRKNSTIARIDRFSDSPYSSHMPNVDEVIDRSGHPLSARGRRRTASVMEEWIRRGKPNSKKAIGKIITRNGNDYFFANVTMDNLASAFADHEVKKRGLTGEVAEKARAYYKDAFARSKQGNTWRQALEELSDYRSSLYRESGANVSDVYSSGMGSASKNIYSENIEELTSSEVITDLFDVVRKSNSHRGVGAYVFDDNRVMDTFIELAEGLKGHLTDETVNDLNKSSQRWYRVKRNLIEEVPESAVLHHIKILSKNPELYGLTEKSIKDAIDISPEFAWAHTIATKSTGAKAPGIYNLYDLRRYAGSAKSDTASSRIMMTVDEVDKLVDAITEDVSKAGKSLLDFGEMDEHGNQFTTYAIHKRGFIEAVKELKSAAIDASRKSSSEEGSKARVNVDLPNIPDFVKAIRIIASHNPEGRVAQLLRASKPRNLTVFDEVKSDMTFDDMKANIETFDALGVKAKYKETYDRIASGEIKDKKELIKAIRSFGITRDDASAYADAILNPRKSNLGLDYVQEKLKRAMQRKTKSEALANAKGRTGLFNQSLKYGTSEELQKQLNPVEIKKTQRNDPTPFKVREMFKKVDRNPESTGRLVDQLVKMANKVSVFKSEGKLIKSDDFIEQISKDFDDFSKSIDEQREIFDKLYEKASTPEKKKKVADVFNKFVENEADKFTSKYWKTAQDLAESIDIGRVEGVMTKSSVLDGILQTAKSNGLTTKPFTNNANAAMRWISEPRDNMGPTQNDPLSFNGWLKQKYLPFLKENPHTASYGAYMEDGSIAPPANVVKLALFLQNASPQDQEIVFRVLKERNAYGKKISIETPEDRIKSLRVTATEKRNQQIIDNAMKIGGEILKKKAVEVLGNTGKKKRSKKEKPVRL